MKTGKIVRFEDLVAWQKARQLTQRIYLVTGKGQFAKDYGLRDQIRRASVSIMSNLAEGFERGSQAEFHQFLVIAKGSCAEVRSQLYIAKDVGYLDESTFIDLMSLSTEVSKIIGGLRSSVQKRRDANK
ncbi:S23 ribosomal protein [Desulfosarcina variabilis str. Montpellier]|uniref:four helix bundle protein n=1 Tax=Desulfosarcina variabilis TaxID=2300 RepID=UPI003AFAEB82